MRQRRVYISFPDDVETNSITAGSQKKIDGVNIRFNVKTYSQAGLPASSHITVYNLNNEDLQKLSTSAATWLFKQNFMQLYAGYDDNVRLLASGQIMEAIPQGNPDVGLEIKLLNGAKWFGEIITLQKSEIKVIDALNMVAEKMGWTVNISDELKQSELLNIVMPEFSFTGTAFEALDTIQAKVGGFNIREKGVNITTYNDEIFVWSAGETGKNPVMVINKYTGMIGYPHPTTAGASVRILLNPNLRAGQLVRIESDRIGFINGDYYIVSLQHEGELRGNDWFTTLECSRASNYKEALQESKK